MSDKKRFSDSKRSDAEQKHYAVIVTAAGQSTRFGNQSGTKISGNSLADKKQFARLRGRTVWEHSVVRFAADRRVDQIIFVVSPEDRVAFKSKFAAEIAEFRLDLIVGGEKRFESVENALKIISPDIDFVAIHDAARPCVTRQQINDVFKTAEEFGAAILASPIVGTVKRSIPSGSKSKKNKNYQHQVIVRDIAETVARDHLWEAQTPQVFSRALIMEAYANRNNVSNITDDAQLVEKLGHTVKIVASDRSNIKITTSTDILIAEQFLR